MPSPDSTSPNRWRTSIGLFGWLVATGLVSSLLLLLNAACLYSVYHGLHGAIPAVDYIPFWQFVVYGGAAVLLYLEWTLFDALFDPIRRRFKVY